LVDERDDLVRVLTEHGIEANMGEVRNDIYAIFGGKRRDLPNMNDVEERYLKVPINPRISVADVEYICDVIRGGW